MSLVSDNRNDFHNRDVKFRDILLATVYLAFIALCGQCVAKDKTFVDIYEITRQIIGDSSYVGDRRLQ